MSKHWDLRTALLQQLQSLARSGVLDLPQSNPQFALPPLPTEPSDESTRGVPTSTTARQKDVALRAPEPNTEMHDDSATPELNKDDRMAALQILQREVAQCTRCSELVQSRTQTVFGVGNVQPRLCFFGEAPGADEDAQGEPFVGRAGQLLDKIIAACKLRRDDVYILNAIKCRPQGNRTPTDSEIDQCWEFARRQLAILRPEFICCLGGVAARSLLKRKDSIGKMRQQFFVFGPSQVIVTYHPAYLLREPNAKRYVWEDMQMLMKAMGIAVI